MRHPGYRLNRGDMFQVNPERVMYALGQPREPGEDADEEDAEAEEEESEPEAEVSNEVAAPTEADIERNPKQVLKDLMTQAKSILESDGDSIGGKRKQDLRAFSKTVRQMLSRSGREDVMTKDIEAQFQEIQNQLQIQRHVKEGTSPRPEKQPSATDSTPTKTPEINYLTASDLDIFKQALSAMQEPDSSESKPYALPWMPREYMSPFAFIPRYLEVNQNICAAVFLGHPTARPGMAEVPTPFPEQINANAFAWYLRRR